MKDKINDCNVNFKCSNLCQWVPDTDNETIKYTYKDDGMPCPYPSAVTDIYDAELSNENISSDDISLYLKDFNIKDFKNFSLNELKDNKRDINTITDNGIEFFLETLKYPKITKEEIKYDENKYKKTDDIIIGDLPDSDITDKSLNILYPKQVGNIMSDYRSNHKFRNCVDDLISLDPEEVENIKYLSEQPFKKWGSIGSKYDHIGLIIKILNRISELNNNSIMRCMETLNLGRQQFCNGALLKDYMEIISVIFNYFHIKIDLTKIKLQKIEEKLDRLINESIPLVKKIFKNTINLSYHIHNKKCNGEKYIPETYDRIYNLLEGSDSLISYKLFDNYTGWWSEFFDNNMTDTWYKKSILLIIFVFIFSKIISLFHYQKEVIKVE